MGLLLDLLEILGGEGFLACEVVIEAVLDGRPDRDLGARFRLGAEWGATERVHLGARLAGRVTATGVSAGVASGRATGGAARSDAATGAGSTNSMYSRLRFGVYGQLIVTRAPSMGSRTAAWPVITMARSVMLMVLLPIPGRPLVDWPPLTETQVLLSISFGASAYAMLARSGCPRFE